MDYRMLRNVLRDSKDMEWANKRESKNLKKYLEGTGGITYQRNMNKKIIHREVNEVKKDLAKVVYQRKKVNPKRFKRCADVITEHSYESFASPLEIQKMEQQKLCKRRNNRLLLNEENNSKNAQEKVRDFLNVLKRENNAQKKSSTLEEICDRISITTKLENNTNDSLPEIPPHLLNNKDIYAPDGELRTKLTLPSIESTWEEARKTRYIRTRILRDFERELSFKEIFGSKAKLFPHMI